jgi:phenylacetate-coenzyme A ligase PaaK-like adenylate-forming protein
MSRPTHVYLFGRADFTVSYFGANIYPENVSVGLEQPSLRGPLVIADQSLETDLAAHQERSAHRGDRGEDHQQDRRDPQRKSGQEE